MYRRRKKIFLRRYFKRIKKRVRGMFRGKSKRIRRRRLLRSSSGINM